MTQDPRKLAAERARFENWFKVTYPLFRKDADTTLKHKLWTAWQVAALDAAPEDNYPTEFDDWWRDAPAFPTEYLAAQAAWNAALKRMPERDVAERVREECARIAEAVSTVYQGGEKLSARQAADSIRNLDLSQFTSCAGGQVVPDSKSSDGAQEAQTAGEPATPALPAGMLMVPECQLGYRVFKDGDRWCAVAPGFIDIQQSPCAFHRNPIVALGSLLHKLDAVPQPADAPSKGGEHE